MGSDDMQGNAEAGALSGVRVLDLTDERAIYGAKLLADLGADVVRPEPLEGDPLRQRGPKQDAASLWHGFFASNRRFVTLDLAIESDQARLAQLADKADIILMCHHGFGSDLLDAQVLAEKNPKQVIVHTSSFGTDGPWRDFLAPDLIAGALGGAVATTGDVDTVPLKSFGELNFMVSGVYAAIAALSALHCVRTTGVGQVVDVPVHECIASCLEHVFMFYWYDDKLMREEGKVLPRRGALHWSDLYAVMKADTGSIMVTPAPDFDKQLAWLIEEGVHEDLIDPKYAEPENLRLRGERTMEVLRSWVATKDAQALFFDAQQRHAPYGWVLPIEKLAENPQLLARDWFADYPLGSDASEGESTVKGPGAPYQFSQTPWRLGPSDVVDADALLAELGWETQA